MNKTIEHEKYWVILMWNTCGGSFVKGLASVLTHADPINTKKIKKTWPDYWENALKQAEELGYMDREG